MTILEEIKKPKINSKPDFKLGETLNNCYKFNCALCESEVEIKYDNQIKNFWIGKTESISVEEEKETKEYYKIGLFRKSIDGGLTVFDKIKCKNCEGKYITYCGVNEFSNSVFNVFVHGIILIEK